MHPSLISLLEMLDAYARQGPYPTWDRPREQDMARRFEAFVLAAPDCLERTCAPGHVTASAMVVDPALQRVLLTHHAKLRAWIQLGGHADGCYPLHEVALREAREECGLPDLHLLDLSPRLPLPFDLAIHDVPAHGEVPRHLHYDVRFVVCAPVQAPLVISSESRDLRWFHLDEARRITSEESMHRQFHRLEWLRDQLLA